MKSMKSPPKTLKDEILANDTEHVLLSHKFGG